MPRPDREFELKITLTAEELDKLARNPRLSAASEHSEKSIRSVYYDTPDHRLHGEGISLRVREDGESFIQTVKLDTAFKNGLSNPIEIENPLDTQQPDLDRIGDKHVRREVYKAVKGSALTQAFETDVTRTTHRFHKRQSIIEVALDKGETRTKGRKSAIYEAELELISGHPKDLLETAQALLVKNGTVHISTMSKAERGYRLLLKTQSSGKIEPVRAETPGIRKGQTCGEAFARILHSAREQIIKNRIAVLETEESEAAHQLRVGLTRLRSAQRALKQFIASAQLHRLETDAQTVARAAGHLRDADVLIEDIYAPIAGNPPRRPGFDQLYLALQAHRAAMQREARQILTGENWSRLLLAMTLWPAMLERDPSLQDPIEDYAGKALQKRWKKAAKLGKEIDSLEGAKRHQMRKALKKLRYTAEFLAPLYKKSKVKDFIGELKNLQDIFGYVNDVAMAGQIRDIAIARCGNDPAALVAAGCVLGHHDGRLAKVWEDAPEAWTRLKSMDRFWQ